MSGLRIKKLLCAALIGALAGTLLVAEELSVTTHDGAKEIKKLPAGAHTIQLTGSLNTALLAKIRKALAAKTNCSFSLDLSAVTGMEKLDTEVLSGLTNLESLTISDSLVSLKAAAFLGCTALHTVSVSDTHTLFAEKDGCLYSKDFSVLVLCPPARTGTYTLPATVTAIAGDAFSVSPTLTALSVAEENTAFIAVSGSIYTRDMKTLVRVPQGRAALLTVPEGVETIGQGALSGCTALSSIRLPATLTRIEQLAFEGCNSLHALTLPERLERIGKQAFLGCSALETVVIPEATVFIGSRAFYRTQPIAITFASPNGWTNGKRELKDLAQAGENPSRFNHPGKYWPYDIYKVQE